VEEVAAAALQQGARLFAPVVAVLPLVGVPGQV
jgi:hypothetical protein